jgi:hypothetical protein
MTQTLVFSTNFCSNNCKHCLCISGPNNDNFLNLDRDVPGDIVHICGGEPLTHPNLNIFIQRCRVNHQRVILYTSLITPYIKEDPYIIKLAEIFKDDPNFGIRISTSQYLKNQQQIVETVKILKTITKSPLTVTTMDGTRIPGIPVVFTPKYPSGNEYHRDYNAGPLMNVIHSDGSIKSSSLINAHYDEAKLSRYWKNGHFD